MWAYKNKHIAEMLVSGTGFYSERKVILQSSRLKLAGSEAVANAFPAFQGVGQSGKPVEQ